MANIVERVGEMLKQLSPLDQRVEALLNQLTLKEKVALLSGLDIWRTVPIERAGHPVDHDDGRPAWRAREPARSRATLRPDHGFSHRRVDGLDVESRC